mgnify:CR=1 FL=1
MVNQDNFQTIESILKRFSYHVTSHILTHFQTIESILKLFYESKIIYALKTFPDY